MDSGRGGLVLFPRRPLPQSDRPERRSAAQIHPCSESPAARPERPLVPGFGVDTARNARRVAERDVLLDRPKIRQPRGHHLFPLPILLKPASPQNFSPGRRSKRVSVRMEVLAGPGKGEVSSDGPGS